MAGNRKRPDWLPDDAEEIAPGHWITYFAIPGHEDAPKRCGVIWWHLRKDNPKEHHAGSAWWWRPDAEIEEGKPVWVLVSEDPLTIAPSIWCNPRWGGCGAHGFIENGRYREVG